MSYIPTLLCLVFLSSAHAQRNVVATLTVSNGAPWGDWHDDDFCPSWTYADGFRIKVERNCGLFCDDTALNGIELSCRREDSDTHEGTISSHVGPWGDWTTYQHCFKVGEVAFFLSAFQLRVEPPQGIADDTAANNVRLRCSDFGNTAEYTLEGDGEEWGNWGLWSGDCPIGSAICGVKTKVEAPTIDNTALNDMLFYCCDD